MQTNKEGSVLVLILVIAVTAGMLLTSLSDLAITEKGFNDDARLLLEAKEAAEATVECGFSQLVSRFEERTSFPINSLSPDANPVILTDDYYDLFNSGAGTTASKVRMPAYPYNPDTAWNTQDTARGMEIHRQPHTGERIRSFARQAGLHSRGQCVRQGHGRG
jgi:hypothetical protein